MKFIDMQKQYETIKEDLDIRFKKVFDSCHFILGPEVKEVEKQLAEFIGVKHAIATASGTDALLIALMALDIKAGDEVITSPFSFFATAEVILLLGAKPVFVDIDPRTYNIDPNLIEQAITKKTKAIMPVSLYGQCAEFDAINQIAEKHGLAVIEDGAQSYGATFKNINSCNSSTIGCTSFFPTKPLGCYGDGGACFTNDDKLAEILRQLIVHGQQSRYYHVRVGITGRLDTLQAAVLLSKLKTFKKEIELRQNIGKKYDSYLANNPNIITPHVESYNKSVYAQYTVMVNNREKIQEYLNKFNIPTMVHYPISLYKQPAMSGMNYVDLPHSEKAANSVLSLPMHPYLSDEEIELASKTLIEAVKSV